jgi:2'-5' RNA ligase
VRLFVAAYPPEPAREDFAGLVRKLNVGQPRERGRSVRLAPAEQWHVTLAFLGEVPDSSVDKARRAVDRAAATWRDAKPTAKAPPEPEPVGQTRTAPAVRFAGGGTFGRGRFTTLWSGLRGDVDALTTVAAALRRELRKARVPHDDKRFRPHLTVARPGDRVTAEELAGDLAILDGYEGPLWTVETLRLMRSHLGPRPSYETVHEVPLTGGPETGG